jgi:hypothetical protein
MKQVYITSTEAAYQRWWEEYEVPIAEAGIIYGKDSRPYRAAVARRDAELQRLKNEEE